MNSKKTKSIGQKAAETAAKTGASGFDNNTGFKLDEKITVEGICTKLLCAGYVQAHIDFFYLFNKNSNIKVPSSITSFEGASISESTVRITAACVSRARDA